MPALYAIGLEPAVLIVSICLPSIFHLAQHGRRHGFRGLFSRKVSGVNSYELSPRSGQSTKGKENIALRRPREYERMADEELKPSMRSRAAVLNTANILDSHSEDVHFSDGMEQSQNGGRPVPNNDPWSNL